MARGSAWPDEAPGWTRVLMCVTGVDLLSGGRYWDRTSDLFGVNEALSR